MKYVLCLKLTIFRRTENTVTFIKGEHKKEVL